MRRLSILVIYFFSIFIIAWRLLGKYIFALNDHQLDRSGDGFKNYFAFAWQYKKEGGLWFEGMQYPYGDLLSYADGQPAITLPLIALKKIGIDFTGQELLVVQVLPILGMLLGAYFLHKILGHYKIPDWWKVVTVIFCLALSPQIYRFNAHFALGYTFCFPSIWYLLILYRESKIKNITYLLLTIFLLVLFAFIHPYHLLIGSFFLLAYFVVQLLSKYQNWSVLVAGVLPIIFYLGINSFLDIYPDRPQNPWGAWEYKAEISDLLPFYGWFSNLFSEVISLRSNYQEGYAYLGILIFLLPFIFLRNTFQKTAAPSKLEGHEFRYVIAALLVLLFAMGLHIILTNHKILDWVSALKQFRALGRFTWPFYYVGFLSLSVYFYRTVSGLKSSSIKYGLLAVVVGLWSLDAFYYTKAFNKNMNNYKATNELYTNTEVKDIISTSTFDINDFQAILPLPVSMEGAEKITPADNWFSKTRAIPFSFQSGLPILGAYMSRTSLSRMLKQYQLGSSAYVKKNILSDLPSQKDLLIVIGKEVVADYRDVLDMGYKIGDGKEVLVYGVKHNMLAKVSHLRKDTLKFDTPLYYDNFSERSSGGLLSEGAAVAHGFTKIAGPVDLKNLSTDSLTLSLWTRIDPNYSTTAFFSIYIKDKNQNTLEQINYRDLNINRCEVIDNWIQLKKTISIPEKADFLDWNITADNLYIDHAIISETTDTFAIKLVDNFVVYNHYIAQVK